VFVARICWMQTEYGNRLDNANQEEFKQNEARNLV
jgi:hypothetical protein